MHWASLHGIHCIQSRCIESTAFNWHQFFQAAWNPLHSIGVLCTMLHGIHCIPSCCMGSTTFNRVPLCQTAWHPLNAVTRHGIHCIQLGCIVTRCMESPSFNHAVWNPMHSMGSIVHRCMEYTAFNHAACNPLHCIGFHCSTLHGIDCIQSCCIKSMAFHRDPLGHTAWNPLH